MGKEDWVEGEEFMELSDSKMKDFSYFPDLGLG